MLRKLLLVIAVAFHASAAPVAAGPPTEVAALSVLPGWRTEDGTHMAGLKITLAQGWKTYWRAPGDAGIPPHFSWSGSENLAGVRFHWPSPKVFHTNGMRSIGYEGQVIIPVEITPRGDGPIRMEGVVDIGVCEEVCVPMTLQFAADLPAGGAPDGRITAALVDRPESASDAKVSAVRCTVEPMADGLRLTATITMPPIGQGEVAVIEAGSAALWVSEPVATRSGAELIAVSDMVVAGASALDRSEIRITVFGGGRVVDIRGCAGG